MEITAPERYPCRRRTAEFAAIALIVLFSLFIRVYYASNIIHPPLSYDARNYDAMARQFLGKGFLAYASDSPNAYVTPGYPLFLAAVYKAATSVGANPIGTVRIIQVILEAAITLLIYLVAKQFTGPVPAVLSAFFYSVYLISMWVPTLILTETLYTFLFVLYLHIQLTSVRSGRDSLSFITGMVFALAILVRPAAAPVLVIPYICLYMQTRDRALFRKFILALSGFTVVMLPWWVRNAVVLKKFIPFATQADPLLRGTYPYGIGEETIPYENQMGVAIKRIIDGFRTQPVTYIKWYTFGKFDYLYFKLFYYVDRSMDALRFLLPLHYVYVLSGWARVVFSVRRRALRLLSLYIICITLIHLVFVATPRYSYPVMPFLIILSSDTIYSICSHIYARFTHMKTA